MRLWNAEGMMGRILTEEERDIILKLQSEGWGVREIARLMNISPSTASKYVTRSGQGKPVDCAALRRLRAKRGACGDPACNCGSKGMDR